MTYRQRLLALLTPPEKKLFERLKTPEKIQDYLDTLPINFELGGETYMSPRRMIRAKTAHCFEGALLAAAALALHGHKPLLMDLRTAPHDEDHVITLFRRGRYWGAISKTNHAVLRYRDAIYRTPRELALSYAHEYTDKRHRKTMREYSAPYDLSRFAPEKWLTAPEELFWLVQVLDDSRHFPLAAQKNLAALRPMSAFESRVLETEEWQKSKTSKR